MIVSGNTSTWEQPPAGSHGAVCYRIIDLGTQTEDFQGTVSVKRKIMLSFEIDEVSNASKERFTISKFYTASLNAKSKLRPDLESWRGRPFSETELKGFDLSSILGKGCLLSIVEGDNGKAKIAAIAQLPKGMPPVKAENEIVNFSFDSFDLNLFESLPDGIKAIIQKSPEYQKATAPKVEMVQQKNGAIRPVPAKSIEIDLEDELEDQIPF
jgi:hypothetical protein